MKTMLMAALAVAIGGCAMDATDSKPEQAKAKLTLDQPNLGNDWMPDDPLELALTFDDGPDSRGVCDRVLDTLADQGIAATFFVNTVNYADVATDPAAQATLLRMNAEGHTIGNHTVHHYDLATTSVDTEAELAGVEGLVQQLLPDAPPLTLVRAPFGSPYFGPQSRLDAVAPIVAKHGVEINWNIDSNDTACSDASCVVRNVLSQVDAGLGGVVLMHCVKPHTADALPEVIAALRDRGVRFVSVEDLLNEKYGQSSRDIVGR